MPPRLKIVLRHACIDRVNDVRRPPSWTNAAYHWRRTARRTTRKAFGAGGAQRQPLEKPVDQRTEFPPRVERSSHCLPLIF